MGKSYTKMNSYYYLFSCAYWYSVKDMNESSAPQEYAFIFVSIFDLLIFVILGGLFNLVKGYNTLNGGIVISVSLAIGGFNYLIFLKDKKYVSITKTFEKLGSNDFKGRRKATLVLAYTITGLLAIIVSAAQIP